MAVLLAQDHNRHGWGGGRRVSQPLGGCWYLFPRWGLGVGMGAGARSGGNKEALAGLGPCLLLASPLGKFCFRTTACHLLRREMNEKMIREVLAVSVCE